MKFLIKGTEPTPPAPALISLVQCDDNVDIYVNDIMVAWFDASGRFYRSALNETTVARLRAMGMFIGDDRKVGCAT